MNEASFENNLFSVGKFKYYKEIWWDLIYYTLCDGGMGEL